MVTAFQFSQQQQYQQLLLGSASASEQGYVVAVLTTATPGLGPFTIAQLLAQSALAGIVFLDQPLLPDSDDQQEFVTAVTSAANGQQILLWAVSPDAVISGSAAPRLPLQGGAGTQSTGRALPVAVTQTLTATLPAGMVLSGQDNAIALTGPTPVSFAGQSAPVGATVVQGAAIQLSGAVTGCFEFTAYLPQSSLAAMNWGFAFGFLPSSGTLPGQLTAPLATADSTVAGFTVDVDPRDGTGIGPARSTLTFTGVNLDRSPTVLRSAYTSASGAQPIQLVPITTASGPAGTVGAQLLISYPPIGTGLPQYLHLVPVGDFRISTGGTDPVAVLCGLQGTEYLVMQPPAGSNPGDFLRFVAGQPAFVPQLPLPVASPVGQPGTGSGPLTGQWTTSWALAMPGSGTSSIVAVAQPPGFGLFGQDDVIYPTNANLLGSATPGQLLSATPSQPMPLVPYGLVAPGSVSTTVPAATVAMLESQVIAPLRHAAVSAEASGAVLKAVGEAGDATSQTFTTPSGYLVTATGGSGAVSWESILLGTLLDSGEQFEFVNPKTTLQQAFQAGQLCLVAANGSQLGTLGGSGDAGQAAFANSLTIGGWGMSADAGLGQSFGDYANVLIVKGMPGPLYDPTGPADANLIANPGKWTNPATFAAPSTVPAGSSTPGQPDPAQLPNLSRWLQDYFLEASQADPAYFASFNALAADPNWTGVLLLRGVISDVPSGLEGITAGVTAPELFNVHHLALNLTPVTVGSTGPTVAKSTSVSGLIYYVDPSANPADPGQPVVTDPSQPYGFRLLSLKVLFENSAVQSFSSYAQVTLRNLFGSAVTGMGSGGNSADALVLTGSFQLVDGQPVYSMASATDTSFLLANNVLSRAEVSGLQMSTVSTGDDQSVTSAFSMAGYLDFALVPGGSDPALDLFGFGNAAGAQLPRQGISFANLVLTMQFPVATPAQSTFGLDCTALRLDLATSTIRAGSLVDQLALQLTGLQQATGSPADAGYLPVIGLVSGGNLGSAWFGLVLDVNLGTPGMLAASAGLHATLLLAWSPASGEPQVQVGLHLPGTAQGAPMISLQNVLKLSIGQIQLAYDDSAGAYLLILDSIALSFLGLLKLPPNGATSFYLFGAPDSSAAGLGWYASYNDEPTNTQSRRELSR